MIDPLNTLMYGDLVYNHRNWICPVVGFDKDKTITVIAQHYGEATYDRSLIHPIPLTEDIILTLGWKVVSNQGDEITYKHPWYTNVLNITRVELLGMWVIIGGNIAIRYLHDLQHILRHATEDDIIYDYENNELFIRDQVLGNINKRIKQPAFI